MLVGIVDTGAEIGVGGALSATIMVYVKSSYRLMFEPLVVPFGGALEPVGYGA